MIWLRLSTLLFVFAWAEYASAADDKAEPEQAELTAADAPSRGAANVPPEVARKAAAIARQTMSPFCPGRTLSDCPSEYATEWRKDIRAMVASGMSAPEIQRELEGRAGSNLSGSPNRDAGWSVPLGLALGAALLLVFVFSKLRRPSSSSSSAPPESSPSRRTSQSDAAAAGGSESSTESELSDPSTQLVDDSRIDEELERM